MQVNSYSYVDCSIQNAVIGLIFILFKVQPHGHVTTDYRVGRQHPETEAGPDGLDLLLRSTIFVNDYSVSDDVLRATGAREYGNRG